MRQSGLGGRRQIVDGGRGESCGALGATRQRGRGLRDGSLYRIHNCDIGVRFCREWRVGDKMKSEMKNGMIGAIVGDIAGSRFEWHNRKCMG